MGRGTVGSVASQPPWTQGCTLPSTLRPTGSHWHSLLQYVCLTCFLQQAMSSRPPTVASRKSSVATRRSQLIAKNTGASCIPPKRSRITIIDNMPGPIELRPSDILIERFEAWKRITKNLVACVYSSRLLSIGNSLKFYSLPQLL